MDSLGMYYVGSGVYLDDESPLWGFYKSPFRDTCVWILQTPGYNYSLANYDCSTLSGFVCEINLPDR